MAASLLLVPQKRKMLLQVSSNPSGGVGHLPNSNLDKAGKQSMKKTGFFVLSMVLALSSLALPSSAQPDDPGQMGLPPPREIPGLTTEDHFPLGCVDCHINMPERNQDERLSTLMSHWSQRVDPGLMEKTRAVSPAEMVFKEIHPRAPASLKDIPATCLSCHEKLSTRAPPLAPLLHAIHLTGGEENHFLSIFQGECTHCHKLDRDTGVWSIPSGPEK